MKNYIQDFSQLVGRTITNVIQQRDADDSDELIFVLEDGSRLKMYHVQDCCESVYISDIEGDWDDIINSEIFRAEESTGEIPEACESGTWTFYKIMTAKGDVWIRWNGESNGYYSESVDLDHYIPK